MRRKLINHLEILQKAVGVTDNDTFYDGVFKNHLVYDVLRYLQIDVKAMPTIVQVANQSYARWSARWYRDPKSRWMCSAPRDAAVVDIGGSARYHFHHVSLIIKEKRRHHLIDYDLAIGASGQRGRAFQAIKVDNSVTFADGQRSHNVCLDEGMLAIYRALPTSRFHRWKWYGLAQNPAYQKALTDLMSQFT